VDHASGPESHDGLLSRGGGIGGHTVKKGEGLRRVRQRTPWAPGLMEWGKKIELLGSSREGLELG